MHFFLFFFFFLSFLKERVYYVTPSKMLSVLRKVYEINFCYLFETPHLVPLNDQLVKCCKKK